MNADDLNLDQPLYPSRAPRFAESLTVAARLVETVMREARFERTGIGRAEDIPEKSKSREDVRLTYLRGPLTAQIDLWDDDCQFTESRRCFAFRPTLTLGGTQEAMPFNRERGGQPSRQQWRQRTDQFVRDLRDQLELVAYADPEERFHGVIDDVQPGYGFIRTPAISRLFFHKSDLNFPWHQVQSGLAVSFLLGENERGRKATRVELGSAEGAVERSARDHATSPPAPRDVRLVGHPVGADEEGRNVGRVIHWRDGEAYGFLESLLEPRLFIHRSALPGVGRYGSYLLGKGVRFQLARAADGRSNAMNADLLPEGVDLRHLFLQEMGRAVEEPQRAYGGQRRFRFVGPNSFEGTMEKRPTITVAALRDILENEDLLFVHTRWKSLDPLQQPLWRELAERVSGTHFLFDLPPLIYLSTQVELYRLSDLGTQPEVRVIDDRRLKAQLELAAPHMDD